MNEDTSQTATHQKRRAAAASVLAAVGLTIFKIIVGLATGSLGILAEAAHSGLDLVAALITLLAVRTSGKPADERHLYGHGKVENLSALFETLLLLITSIWIIYEAIQRIFFKSVFIDVSVWAFVVMGVSIVVDINRSRMLYRVAQQHNSQALEADALHFRTDIWSSSVVILGLAGVKVAELVPGLAFLHKADAAAAWGVALIVAYVSLKLGLRTIQALLDVAPPRGMVEEITRRVQAIPGVIDCHHLRLRHSGPYLFVDLHVRVNGQLSLREAHAITEQIESSIRHMVPDADVTVHAEPAREVQPNT